MWAQVLAWGAVGLIAIAATGVLLARDWRWNLGLMAAQYLAAAILTTAHLPLGMAAAFLVAGWMSVAALGMTLTALPPRVLAAESSWPQARAFRLFMAGMVYVLAAGLTPRISEFVAGIGSPVIAGSILLMGIGFLLLGTNAQVAPIILGLFTVLMGFEVFYSAVEGSILVAGMLAAVNLGLGLAGAYLSSSDLPEEAA
jgi:hypothetical protein